MEIGFIALFLLFVIVAAIGGFFISLGLRSNLRQLQSKVENTEIALRVLGEEVAALRRIGLSAPNRDAQNAAEPAPESIAPEQPTQTAMTSGLEPQSAPAEDRALSESTPQSSENPLLAAASASSVPKVRASSTANLPPLPDSQPAPPAAPPRDLESLIGTRWAVWVGALALAIGGVFLVRYSIEQGLFGPGMRIASGLAFSAFVAAAGEYMRRRMPSWRMQGFEQAPIAPLLTAVATMSAFGTVYAAHALYDIVGPTLAFIALAVIALSAVLAAGLHGPWLAGLGLLGAMVTPVLIDSPNPSPWPVVTYLAFVGGAGYGTAMLRGWPEIGRTTAIGVFIWGLLLAFSGIAQGAPLGVFLITQSLLVAYTFAYRPYVDVPDPEARPELETHLALGGCALLCILVAVTADVPQVWSIALLTAIFLGTAWQIPAAAGAALLAGVVVIAELVVWPGLPRPAIGPGLIVSGLGLPESVTQFLWLAAFFSLALLLVPTHRLWRGGLRAITAAIYATSAVVPVLVIVILSWMRVHDFGVAPAMAATAGLVALGFGLLAVRFRMRDGMTSAIAMEAFAAGGIAALALGLTMLLDRGYLTVSFALAAAGAAWVTSRGPVNALRIASGVLAAIVLARIFWDPAIMAGNPGSTPIINWLLVGYGVPAAAFYAAGRFLKPGGEDVPYRLMEGMTILFATLLMTFEIRHLFHGADLLAARTTHLELGLHFANGIAITAVLMRLDPLDRNPIYRYATLIIGGLSALLAVSGLFIGKNPILGGGLVQGGMLANSLFIGYALPALACGALALIARDRRPKEYLRAILGLGLALAFAYVSLMIRRIYHGPDISFVRNITGQAELWTYSAVWLALGVGLLVAGIARHSRSLRLVSAVFVLASVLKVFLLDMAGLTGFWRAISFIGLGGVLMGIGFLYQRFGVLKRKEGT